MGHIACLAERRDLSLVRAFFAILERQVPARRSQDLWLQRRVTAVRTAFGCLRTLD